MIWILVVVIALGIALATTGAVGIIRDGRRIGALAYSVVGLCVTLFATGSLLFLQGHEGMLLALGVSALFVLVLGNLVGYPALVIFLLWSGITVLRRESRTLGNMLSLLAGVGLLLLPVTLDLLEPRGAIQDDPAYLSRYALHFAAVLVVGYVTFIFGCFFAASLVYRWRPSRIVPEAIIILGAGLINGKVPPLLAGRLQRAIQVHRHHAEQPLIITSGGQGADEPLPEGSAMRDYLIDQGVNSAQVVAETLSANTEQNLRFSRKLLTAADSPVVVVTSSYHVFRAALLTRSLDMRAHVVGAQTAWYYLPSATLREFIGVMREQLRIHLLSLTALVAFAVLFTIILIPSGAPPQ